MEIYRVLSSIMQERNLTVADIARLSGVADSTIRGIVVRKQNKVSLDIAFKLSEGLGVSLEYLNGITENEKNPHLKMVRTKDLMKLILSITS